ncbi:ferredoxin [Paenibacillus sp. 598K]|uniref:2Fe-2S iron-sulfur cluster-binding protein n=1 Tax=Paenibacillus sp. 598K TaxID=1117987 RepID=UPI000FFA05E6|nr:2Fe-2S iron-sulfur cluster-binding protein [Paenibacillus sp. 598K]GBF72758.1 ferredoxin [Paenibacillus sp. 598K]
MKAEITFLPDNKTISVAPGTTVMDAARRAGIAIRSRCGGKAGCLMCKVTDRSPSADGLSPAAEAERRKLGGLLAEGARLACQARVVGETVVEVPEDPLKAAIRRRLAEAQQEDELW